MTATRPIAMFLVLLAASFLASPALAAPFTTVERTIQDRDGDDLLEYAPGEDHVFTSELPPPQTKCEDGRGGRFQLPRNCSILHFLQLSDFQMVDEESPARVEFFDTTQRGPFNPFSSAYRPQESLTTQVTESMVRQARNSVSPVTANPLELTILTGDNADSQQYNETRWFIDILDGTAGPGNPDPEAQSDPSAQDRKIEPNSGRPTDADPDSGLPPGACDATPGSIYDGVRNNGTEGPGDPGPAYYEPDATRLGKDDGDGYSPDPARNFTEVGRRVTVRDFPGLLEDANEPFEAIGLDMPWYTAFGNHDALVQGNDSNAYFGPGGVFNPVPNAAEEKSNPLFQAIATGCVKPTSQSVGLELERLNEQVRDLIATSAPPEEVEAVVTAARKFLAEQAAADEGGAMFVPPDRRRCFLAKDEPKIGAPDPCAVSWIDQHFKTTGTPEGHGFEQRPPEAELNNDGYYSFAPKPGLRMIALDTVTDECGTEFCSEGSIDETQFEWLRRELHAAAQAGEYAIPYGHHTLRTMRQPTDDPTEEPIHYGQRFDREDPSNPQTPSRGDTLEELFCQNPNVLAYVAGHEHANVVERHECGKDAPPTPGPGDFVEVGTAAHIDFPQQSRMIELVDAGGEMAMVLTMLDHNGPANPGGPPPRCSTERGLRDRDSCGEAGEEPTRLSSIARELTFNDYQHSRGARGEPDDRNIIVPLGRPFPCPSGPGESCDPSASDSPPGGG